FIDELDDFEGGAAYGPGVAMYENGDFVVMFPKIETAEFGVRWFDPEGLPYGPSVTLAEQLTHTSFASQTIIAGDVDTHTAYRVLNGRDEMSSTSDVFAITRGPELVADLVAIYQGPAPVYYADMALDGDVATFVWAQDGEI